MIGFDLLIIGTKDEDAFMAEGAKGTAGIIRADHMYVYDHITLGVQSNLETVMIFESCLYLVAQLKQSDETTSVRTGHMDHGITRNLDAFTV